MMGAREWVNNHPKVAIGVGVAIVVLAISLIVTQVLAGRHRYPSGPPTDYFTADDGKTFFAAGEDNIPPFDYGGQQAVRAHVFQCGSQTFVGYMERFIPKFHDYVVAHGITPEALRFGREIKKPGEAQWHAVTDVATEVKLTTVVCPNGGSDTPDEIGP
jgi:hypothetical protein